MRVVLDTNVLFDDPAMVRDSARRVLDLLHPARATLVFSPVVIAELDRKRSDDVEDLRAPIQSRIKRLARLAGMNPAEMLDQTDAIAATASARWTSRWKEILGHGQVESGPWPEVSGQELASRELARRRPFLDKGVGTVGSRDTLIWLGVLELVNEDPDDPIVFVTADKGFLGDTGLHAHLAEDLNRAGASDCVTWLGSLPALVAALQAEAETTGWEDWRETKVLEALYDRIREFIAGDFVEHWDQRDGGTVEPTFDIGLPFTGHEWTLSEVHGPQDLELEHPAFGAVELSCTFAVDVSLSGFMDKFEWYSDEHPEVDLWDADWNDQVVSVEASRHVRFHARMEIDDTAERAHFAEFTETSVGTEQGAMTLG